MALLFFGTLLLQALAAFLQSLSTQMLGQKVMYDLRNRLFAHLQKLSISFFDKNPAGRIITRVTSDVENLNQLFTEGIVAIIGDIFLIVGIVCAMLFMNRTLALWSFTVLPVLVVATFIFRKMVRKGFEDIRFHLARINTFLQENITGMKTVQLFLREAKNLELFSAINRDHTRAHERTIMCFAVFFPVVEIISSCALALVIYKGGEAVGAGLFGFGVVYAFIRYLEMFFRPLSDLAEKYNIVQAAIVSSERIFGLLDREPEIRDRTDASRVDPPVERVAFDEVVFGYDADNPVLKGVSFSVDRGQTLALVGHTGAGKTTVINLLQRFYDIQSGSIRVNGTDIRELEQRALRGLMVSVQQDPFIFSGKIRENIRLGEERITPEQVKEAARLVNAAPFIEALPQNYATDLVEKGENLSTGQKQLLSFARAMVFDPEILILDEATANIDTPTEALIQAAIAELTRKRTSIIIAHRLSTIQNADKIIVLHKGEMAEEGNHQELLSKRGLYWRLYQRQYKEQRIRGKSA
jgi:ATP-binding cassette subfamily B protein